MSCSSRYRALWSIASALLVALWAGPALGQSGYPVKPIRLVVPFPPGASNDVLARTVAEKMREALGQPIVVDNRGGAGTAIGSDIVAKSPPDGYTWMFSSVSYATNAAVQSKLPFDPADITGIAMVAKAPLSLVVHPAVPAKSVKELIALARARPWWGMFTRAGTPGAIIALLSVEILKILATDDMKRRLSSEGAEPAPMSAIDFNVFVRNEIVKWTRLVRERKIPPE